MLSSVTKEKLPAAKAEIETKYDPSTKSPGQAENPGEARCYTKLKSGLLISISVTVTHIHLLSYLLSKIARHDQVDINFKMHATDLWPDLQRFQIRIICVKKYI